MSRFYKLVTERFENGSVKSFEWITAEDKQVEILERIAGSLEDRLERIENLLKIVVDNQGRDLLRLDCLEGKLKEDSQMQAQNRVLMLKDVRRGMVLVPFWGESTYQRKVEDLNWTPALYREWWQHIVVGISDTDVTLARPYAYAREHFDTNTPLIGCETYRVCKDSTHPYMLMRENFTT